MCAARAPPCARVFDPETGEYFYPRSAIHERGLSAGPAPPDPRPRRPIVEDETSHVVSPAISTGASPPFGLLSSDPPPKLCSSGQICRHHPIASARRNRLPSRCAICAT